MAAAHVEDERRRGGGAERGREVALDACGEVHLAEDRLLEALDAARLVVLVEADGKVLPPRMTIANGEPSSR